MGLIVTRFHSLIQPIYFKHQARATTNIAVETKYIMPTTYVS